MSCKRYLTIATAISANQFMTMLSFYNLSKLMDYLRLIFIYSTCLTVAAAISSLCHSCTTVEYILADMPPLRGNATRANNLFEKKSFSSLF